MSKRFTYAAKISVTVTADSREEAEQEVERNLILHTLSEDADVSIRDLEYVEEYNA